MFVTRDAFGYGQFSIVCVYFKGRCFHSWIYARLDYDDDGVFRTGTLPKDLFIRVSCSEEIVARSGDVTSNLHHFTIILLT